MPLVASSSLRPLFTQPGRWAIPALVIAGRRVGGYKYISLQQTPSTTTTEIDIRGTSRSAISPDAEFEILGTPYSLLSISLSPSQSLHTRRGTLLGISGDPSATTSVLRTLNPIRRALIGIPFLYQRLTSTTPISLLLAPSSPNTTLTILQLDGTTDWKLAQRKAVLAWTGNSLNITPTVSTNLSLSHWGTSDATGRGLLCLAGQGHIFSIDLAEGESYVAHPSNILAYTTSGTSRTRPTPLPQPYRFRSAPPRFAIPLDLGNWFPSSRFGDAIRSSGVYKFLASVSLRVKTWSRRTIFGDRLFLRFEGPTTILVQSRASRVRDILTKDQVNEIADAPAGQVMQTIRKERIRQDEPQTQRSTPLSPPQGPPPANSAQPLHMKSGTGTGAQSNLSATRGLGPMGGANTSQPLSSQDKTGPSLSSKPDASRMGVQGGQVSSQTTTSAEKNAPQIVEAEKPSATSAQPQSAGAVEAEAMRRQLAGKEKPATEKEIRVGNEAQKGTDHA